MRIDAKHGNLLGVALVGILALGTCTAGPAIADRPTRDTLTPATWHLTYNQGPEIELLSSPPRVEVTLEGTSTHGGVTPFSIPGNLHGRYTLAAFKPGFAYASRQLEFVFEDRNQPTAAPVAAARSRALLLAMPPGVVEWQQGDRLEGTVLATSELAAIAGSFWAHQRAVDAASTSRIEAARAAAATGDERERLVVASSRAAAQERAWKRAEHQWLGFGAGLWALTYLTRAHLTPGLETRFDGAGRLSVELEPLSRGSAALRSLLVPGWGQAYSGRRGAGQGFMVGSLSMVSGLLLADQAYARAEADLEHAAEYLEYVRKVDFDAAAIAQEQLDHAGRVADRAWSTRRLTFALTAGLWAYNLFDAVLHARGPDPMTADNSAAPTLGEGRAGEETADGPELSALLPVDGRLGVALRF
jgi:hypothetical protein